MTPEECARVRDHVLKLPIDSWEVSWNNRKKYIGLFTTVTPKGTKLRLHYNEEDDPESRYLSVYLYNVEYRYTDEESILLKGYHHELCLHHKIFDHLKKLKAEEEANNQRELEARLLRIDEMF